MQSRRVAVQIAVVVAALIALGRIAAVLVNYDEYERLKDSLEVLSDPDLMKQIRRSKSFYAKGKQGMSFEAVFGESLHARKQRKP